MAREARKIQRCNDVRAATKGKHALKNINVPVPTGSLIAWLPSHQIRRRYAGHRFSGRIAIVDNYVIYRCRPRAPRLQLLRVPRQALRRTARAYRRGNL